MGKWVGATAGTSDNSLACALTQEPGRKFRGELLGEAAGSLVSLCALCGIAISVPVVPDPHKLLKVGTTGAQSQTVTECGHILCLPCTFGGVSLETVPKYKGCYCQGWL